MRDWTRQQSEARRAKEVEEGEDMAAYWAYLERVRSTVSAFSVLGKIVEISWLLLKKRLVYFPSAMIF